MSTKMWVRVQIGIRVGGSWWFLSLATSFRHSSCGFLVTSTGSWHLQKWVVLWGAAGVGKASDAGSGCNVSLEAPAQNGRVTSAGTPVSGGHGVNSWIRVRQGPTPPVAPCS